MRDSTDLNGKPQSGAGAPDQVEPYEMWRQRLDKTPSGAPKHPAILKLLRLYCTPDEADFLSRMPAQFCSPSQLAKLYKTDIPGINRILEGLVRKFLVAEMDCGDGVRLYASMEIIPGFWDLSFMRGNLRSAVHFLRA